MHKLKRPPFVHPDAFRQFEMNLNAANIDAVEDAASDLEDLGYFLDEPISAIALPKQIPVGLCAQLVARSKEVTRQQRELAGAVARLTIMASKVYNRKEREFDRAEAKRVAAIPHCPTCDQLVQSKGKGKR